MTAPGKDARTGGAAAPAVVTIEDIRAAAKAIEGVLLRTPCLESPALSELTGARVALKLEGLQRTGSFKERGALVKLSSLDTEVARRGVVAASAGNHAQGVAFHAKRLGIPAIIFMPKGTPFTKVERTEAYGARVALEGKTLAEATKHALTLAKRKNLTFIHPYDDPWIIAGQGTIALEMLADDPGIEMLVVPVGGGGLIAGNALAAKAVKPDIEVIGVETALYPSMYQAVRGLPATSGGVSLADGIAVRKPGTIARKIIEERVDDLMVVDEDAVERAVQSMAECAKVVAEGAGAAPLAAMLTNRQRFAGRRVGLIVSGANIEPRTLATILMRGLAREGRIARLRIEAADVPGSLARVAKVIGQADANIIEIVHQRLFHDVPVRETELDIVIETRDFAHVHEIVKRLIGAGFPTRLLSSTATG
jgi:threonine dehydratase